MTVEARLVWAHIELQIRPTDLCDVKFMPVARYGLYEVRLVEPPHDAAANTFDFWLELFDHGQKISVDSGGADDLETAVTIAEAFVADAKELNKTRPEFDCARPPRL